MQGEGRYIPATLAHLAAQEATARQIADLAASLWCQIDSTLSPIIGQRGIAALYKRSLYLTRGEYSFLTAVFEGEATPDDAFAPLQSALAQQPRSAAAAAAGDLLLNFHDLLSTLIGASLTERLLRSIWDHPSSGDAVQDTSR